MIKEEFSDKCLVIFEDRNMATPSPEWIEMLFNQAQGIPDSAIEKGISDMMYITQEKWNKDFGYNGKPAITEWLNFFGSRPLTEIEIAKKKRDYEANLRLTAETIYIWVNDPNLEVFFPSRYKNPEYKHLKCVIDKFLKIREELPKDRIIKMAIHLKKKFLDNPAGFRKEIVGVTREQLPLLLT